MVIMICCKISVGHLAGWLDTWIAVRKCRGDNYSLAALYSNTPQIVNTKRNKYFTSPVLIRTPLFWPFDAAFPARFITAGRLAGFAANLGFYWSFWERQCWQANSVVNIDFHQKHLANRGLASFSTHYDFQTISKSILTLTGFFCSWLPRAVGSWQHQSIAKNKRLSCYQTRQGKGAPHIYVQIHGLIQHKDCNFPELMRKRSTKSGFCIQTIFHCLDIIGSRSSKWLESSNGIP